MNGYATNNEHLLLRLRKAEGRVRGVARMVDDDVYCIDVLTQISAVTKALETIGLMHLDDHLTHCVTEASAQGDQVAQVKIREASTAIVQMVRS